LSRQLQDKVGGVAPAGLFSGERYFTCGKEAKAIRRNTNGAFAALGEAMHPKRRRATCGESRV